jgi:SAM-dependent methyltransferase
VVTDLQMHFDTLFSANEDPWNYRSSWPERRRLELLLAMMPNESYDSIFEPACANGTLTKLLAPRARQVIAWDGSSEALRHAKRHVSTYSNVELAPKSVPDEWPDATFDAIVLSDFLYYLPEERIADVAMLAGQSVSPSGTVVACHWRGSAHDFRVQGGDAVHDILRIVLGVPSISYADDRQLIDMWTP